MTNFTFTNKKTGVVYTCTATLTEDGKSKFELTPVEDGDVIVVSESTLTRWYKKQVNVDFTNAEEDKVEEPKAEPKAEPKKAKKEKDTKKASKPEKAEKPAKAEKKEVEFTELTSKEFGNLVQEKVDYTPYTVRVGSHKPRKLKKIGDSTAEFKYHGTMYRVTGVKF